MDEAHKMSAYLYGDKTRKTKRYQVGEVVADNSSNLVFLTATPHKGDPDNFRLLLSLLDDDVFSSKESMGRILSKNKEEYILRRMKEELKGFDGKRLFPSRDVTTVGYVRSSLENRRRRLQTMLDNHQLVQEMQDIYGDIEDMPEEPL